MWGYLAHDAGLEHETMGGHLQLPVLLAAAGAALRSRARSGAQQRRHPMRHRQAVFIYYLLFLHKE